MKSVVHRLPQLTRTDDCGMTLIEVIVAISIMGIIATAAVGLSITSQTSAAAQQRQELAVTIANQAMEYVSAQAAGTNPLTKSSYLVQGRTQAAVKVRWDANLGIAGLADTNLSYDLAAPVIPPVAVPIYPPPTKLSGTDYYVDTLIGTCYQPTSSSPLRDGPCLQPASANTSQVLRVIVVVRWKAGSGCAASGCSYQTTTLIDPHDDQQWVTSG